MTTTTKCKALPKKRNWRGILLAVMIFIIVLVVTVLLLTYLAMQRQSELEDYQNEKIQWLIDRQGEYDERSIVLSDTTESLAKELAKKLNADLRISSDGSFAALTLPEGTTILDVYRSDEYIKDLPRMSADCHVKTSELAPFEEEIPSEHLPSRPQYTVTDSDYDLQTYLDYLNMKNIWSKTRGWGITVAVIDTGIDTNHPEFAGRISEYSYNATEDKIVKDYLVDDGSYDWSLIEDEQGHGTAVAGVIGASMNNGSIVGIAPEVTLLIIKAECDVNGTFERTSDLVFGLMYAIERDVAVVNMSFGTYGKNDFAGATQLAYDSDVICVAAAGNNSTADLCYPAADEHVFGVGALEKNGWNLADYSNYGENTDFVAPGTVYTTQKDGGYGTMDGTSFASPVTSGVLALYLSMNKYQEFDTVQELIYASCYDLGDLGCDWYFGYGALDAGALLLEERGTVTFNMLTDELENTTQTFIRNHTLQNMPEPERLYAIFDGWYYDPQCTDEYEWYADEFTSDLTLYANWVNEEDGIPYTYVELEDGTIEIRSYKGRRRYITIPDYIDGKAVTSIGIAAFAGQTRLRGINLPKHLVCIRDRAFFGCNNLLNISVPDTVTEIGKFAFCDNVRLSYVAFGGDSRLNSIGAYAFQGCAKLTRFELPATVVSVDGSAFYGATSMRSFAVRNGNTAFTAKDGVLFNYTAGVLVCYPAGLTGEYIIPSTVHSVGAYAFGYTRLKQIDLAKVESIGGYGFIYSSLEKIAIPHTVKRMGEYVFSNSYSLRSVQLGMGLTSISYGTFASCTALKDIEIPENIQTIENCAFKDTTSMTEVTFASGIDLVGIGYCAFSQSGLREVEIPSSVIWIGAKAFCGDVMLSSVTFGDGSKLQTIGENAFEGDMRLSRIILPANLVYIGDFAFLSTGLKTVTVPSAVTTLGEGAFASCHSLTEIKVEEDNANYLDVDGVVYNKAMTTLIEYPAGNAKTSYTVADGVTAIGKSAFYGSWNLNRVTLSDEVETVDEYAFYNCKNVNQYNLCKALTYIKQYAFAGNTSLRRVSIPDNVMQISQYAFAWDWSLSSVTFTENSKLPRISYGAFAYCGLTYFRVPANVSTIAQGAFEGCFNLTSFTFAANSKLQSISAYMFDDCDNLKTITFEPGSALTSIQAHGFEGMRKLTSVDFGNAKLTNIDNFAFRFCESLTSFTIPSGVTSLGRYAFYYCTNLKSVTVPQSVEHIGRFAFLGTQNVNIYFAAETLPKYLAEDWDHGVAGYYLGVLSIVDDGDWHYAKLTDGNVAIIKYTGSETALDLTALDFGSEIVNIGGEAFAYGTVESVKLPESTVTIQAKAFYHSALKSISIPEGVKFIGREAFADTPIQILTFADNAEVSVIEQSAFENTKQLTAVMLPASLEQLGRAIFKNSGIRMLDFADGFSLTEIPEEAFEYTNITTLELPDSVTTLGHSAFRDTASLETVVFGSGADLMLNSNVFYNSGLKSLEVPANMTYIGEYALVGLSELTEFSVSEDNPNYKAVDGLLVSKDGRKLIAVPAGRTGSLTVPAGIEVIGFGAFEDSKLSEVLFLGDTNILSFGYRAFFGMKNLTEIEIPSSVVAIDYYAFANCTALEKVTFAEGNLLRGVYEGAFSGCSSLKSITIPDSVTSVYDGVFFDCESLTSITFGENSRLTSIGDVAFYGCSSLKSITIPNSVTSIGYEAFYVCDSLTSITFGENSRLTSVGWRAFYGCESLVSITIPDSVTSIGNEAFYVCDSLTSITFGENSRLTSIGYDAFYDCNSLTSITIPDSVTSIGNEAFCGCSSLSTIYVSPNNQNYCFVNGILYDKPITKIVYVSKNISGNIIIQNGVTSIGNSAFSYYKNLLSITIPDSVTSIGGEAFRGCSSLTSITFGENSRLTSVGWWAFSGCDSLTSITFGENSQLTSIGNSAFYGCSSLTSITIPESVTSIGYDAFFDCSNLTSVHITDIASWCNIEFDRWSNNPLCYAHNLYLNNELVTNLVIPDSVTSIGERAFYHCNSLTSVTIGNNVTSIGNSAFYYCESLTSITIPDSVTSIGNDEFYGCSSLTSVTIGNGVTSIGNSAFHYCSIKDITIPNSVTSIGDYAFESCEFLYAIYNNSELQFTMGDSSNYGGIAYYAKMIVDKNGNKTYRDEASGFEYIDTADGFRFMKENGEYQLIAYLGTEDTVTLPKDINGNSYVVYKMRGVRNVIISDSMTSIDEYAFYYCDSLTSVKIGNSVTSIGERAFQYCSSLASVTIGNNVTSIDGYAFYGCRSLTSVTIGNSMISIGSEAFYDCRSLTSVTIGNSMISIGSEAFYDCKSLTSITIPDSVTSISSRAFSGCERLASIMFGENSRLTSIDCSAFSNTAYYNNPDNWDNGALFIGNHLIRLSEDAVFCAPRGGALANGSLDGCYKLKHLTIGGNHPGLLSGLTNLETLVITEMPSDGIYKYFDNNSSNVPITLKNIVLADGVRMTSDAFRYISGVTIYVAANEKDVRWDENFKDWNNGNKVVYGDKWITVDFYAADGRSLISSEIFMTSQVIRQPYVDKASDDQYWYDFVGWDLDGDGVADTVPATSTVDISAKPIFDVYERMYAVYFYDKDGKIALYRYLLPYGSTVPLPQEPTKTGYTFAGWDGYTDGMTVTGDISIYSKWVHNGTAHDYTEIIWVAPTCTEKGYNKHICAICGEWYGTDYVDAIDHSYSPTTILPTCTEQGYERHTCIHCGDNYCDNYTEAAGHTFGEWITDRDPTCTEQGARHHVCGSCHTIENEVVPPLGHSYSSESLREATCTEYGEILYTCDNCGTQSKEYTEKTAHRYQKKEASKLWIQVLIEKILNILFGYEGDQAYYYECVDCHRIQTRDETTTSPSSSSSASAAQSTCHHILGEWTEFYGATCVTCKVETRRCSVCEKNIEFRRSTETGDHNYQTKWSNDESYHWHECSVCGDKNEKSEHIYGDNGGNTCSECGYIAYTLGDLDGNDTVDKDDAVYLLMYTFFPDDYPVNQACDFDGSGNVDKDDATYLLMYSFFPDSYPLSP